MNEHVEEFAPEAEEAVRAYIRMNLARLAQDGSLLAMLLPDRFAGETLDMQIHVIEKLRAENAALKTKLEAVERAVKAWGSLPKS
jgi:BMFP domain-containing protein YqiC